jgi:XTP/dITP diphosphohydrolase
MNTPIYFASQNPHKLREVRSLTRVDIRPLSDLGFGSELEETGTTLESNALQKARFVHNTFGVSCFAEDTGLEIEALTGEPGVQSARYAGENKLAEDNIRLVLERLQGKGNRRARFRAVIALVLNGEEHLFEGVLEGTITGEARGQSGFGYDPIFLPLGSARTLAEMTPEEKNVISHRGSALRAMMRYLDTKQTQN